MSWKTASIVLAVGSSWLLWRDCHRPAPITDEQIDEKCEAREKLVVVDHSSTTNDSPRPESLKPSITTARAEDGGIDAYGFHVPGWALSLLPQAGEDMLAYRDRIVPLAQAAIAPQRSRLAKSRENLAQVLNLDAHQRDELDAATSEAASAIQDRVMNGLLGGEFAPQTFKPMTGIAAAQEVLSIVAAGNKRFLGSLSDDQRSKLATHPFDFADYLLFSTKWEEALGVPAPK